MEKRYCFQLLYRPVNKSRKFKIYRFGYKDLTKLKRKGYEHKFYGQMKINIIAKNGKTLLLSNTV